MEKNSPQERKDGFVFNLEEEFDTDSNQQRLEAQQDSQQQEQASSSKQQANQEKEEKEIEGAIKELQRKFNEQQEKKKQQHQQFQTQNQTQIENNQDQPTENNDKFDFESFVNKNNKKIKWSVPLVVLGSIFGAFKWFGSEKPKPDSGSEPPPATAGQTPGETGSDKQKSTEEPKQGPGFRGEVIKQEHIDKAEELLENVKKRVSDFLNSKDAEAKPEEVPAPAPVEAPKSEVMPEVSPEPATSVEQGYTKPDFSVGNLNLRKAPDGSFVAKMGSIYYKLSAGNLKRIEGLEHQRLSEKQISLRSVSRFKTQVSKAYDQRTNQLIETQARKSGEVIRGEDLEKVKSVFGVENRSENRPENQLENWSAKEVLVDLEKIKQLRQEISSMGGSSDSIITDDQINMWEEKANEFKNKPSAEYLYPISVEIKEKIDSLEIAKEILELQNR